MLPEFVTKSGPGRYRLQVWVQPGAKRTELAGLYQGCLKIRLKAPPVDNKANKELMSFLAAQLEIRSNQVELVSGQSGRKKVLHVNMSSHPDWRVLSHS